MFRSFFNLRLGVFLLRIGRTDFFLVMESVMDCKGWKEITSTKTEAPDLP